VFDLDTAIAELLPALNERPFQRLPGSRASTFAEIDRPALQPLPSSRYEMARFKRARVHIDYHVQVEGHFYSVPHALVGQEIEVRITASAIECLHRGRRVAAHGRNPRQGAYTTVAEHLPAAHRAHLEWTPTRLIEWGRRIGVACAEVVERMLAEHKHPEHGYRRCLGLLSLARTYGPQRLEAACALALQLGSCRYRSVRDILANHRDRSPGSDEGDWTSPSHENVRGPGYYQ
jgi:hypothetical protein